MLIWDKLDCGPNHRGGASKFYFYSVSLVFGKEAYNAWGSSHLTANHHLWAVLADSVLPSVQLFLLSGVRKKSISRSEADDIWSRWGNPPWSSCQSLIFRRGVSSSWPSIGSTRVNTSRVFSSKLLFSTLDALEMKCKYLNYFSFYQVLVALKYLYLILYSMIIAPVQIHFCMKSQACNVITLCPFHLWYAATSYVSICFDVALFLHGSFTFH